MFKYSLTLLFVFMSIVTYTQKRFVFEMDIEKISNDTLEITYYNPPKCYYSEVRVHFKKGSVIIKTDSSIIIAYVLKHYTGNTNHRIKSRLTNVTSMLCVNRDKVFYFKEFYKDDHYFCVLRPIRLEKHNRQLGGHGKLLVVSSRTFNCDSLKKIFVYNAFNNGN